MLDYLVIFFLIGGPPGLYPEVYTNEAGWKCFDDQGRVKTAVPGSTKIDGWSSDFFKNGAGSTEAAGVAYLYYRDTGFPSALTVGTPGMAGADLVIGCDPIVTAGKETVLRMREGRTRVALNGHGAPTAAFVRNADWANPADACVHALAHQVAEGDLATVQAERIATRLLGDSLFTNPVMLGYAWQRGWIPLALESILRAIELNEVSVDANKAAFAWGRRAAVDWASVEKLLTPAQVVEFKPRETLDGILTHRAAFLTDYQDAAYARRYREFVERVRAAEAPLGRTTLTESVARYLFKLMAYKDEYEVARLHTQTGFLEKVAAQFEGDFKVNYHLAPPLLARRNERGELVKRKYGPAMGLAFRVLARLKGLRGTRFDPFGQTAERRTERALVEAYRASLEEVMASLDAGNHALAVEIARLPEQIRGFGHVKERNLAAVRKQWDALMARWRSERAAPVAPSPADRHAA